MKNIYLTLPTIILAAFLLWVPVVVTNFTVDTAVAHALGGNNGGSGGSGGSSGGNCCTTTPTPTPTPTPSPVLPVCEISANPGTVTAGGNSTLTWSTTRAIKASIDQSIGSVAIGSNITRVVSPTGETKYTMTVESSTGHKATCNTTVKITPVVVPLPTCDSFTAAPTSLPVGGGSVNLVWNTTNATTVKLDGQVVNADDSKSVTVTANKTFTLDLSNTAGTKSCEAKVTVATPTPLPTCDSFTAAPTSLPVGGGSVNLVWNTTNATTVKLDGQVVNADDSKSVTVTANKTFTLDLSNTAGTKSCTAAVTVNQPEASITCASVEFTASSYSIREGNSTTLNWTTRNGIDNVRINNGVNSTALNGSESVSPRSDTIYTLTASKGNGTPINCPLTINVDEDNGGGGGGSSSPKCTLKISDNKISLGERVTIKWDTTRATEVTLKDNHGKTLIDTDDKSSSEKKDLYDGEITLRPEKDTTYTLVAEKGSKDKTCKVSVDVEDTIVVTQVRDQQPLVTGIALTQVPYTGFEAGPFMTSVFYTLLAAWALYMAYVLVGRRNGMNASAFTPATVTADIVPATAMFTEKVTAAPVFYQAQAAPVVASTATVGYDAHVDATSTIEAQAHAAHVLLSSDAIGYFIAATAGEDREAILSRVLAAAKASYPSEDGWVVVSAERMMELASKF